LRDPTDERRNLLIHVNPEEEIIEFAPAKEKPPGAIGTLQKVSLWLDHLLH